VATRSQRRLVHVCSESCQPTTSRTQSLSRHPESLDALYSLVESCGHRRSRRSWLLASSKTSRPSPNRAVRGPPSRGRLRHCYALPRENRRAAICGGFWCRASENRLSSVNGENSLLAYPSVDMEAVLHVYCESDRFIAPKTCAEETTRTRRLITINKALFSPLSLLMLRYHPLLTVLAILDKPQANPENALCPCIPSCPHGHRRRSRVYCKFRPSGNDASSGLWLILLRITPRTRYEIAQVTTSALPINVAVSTETSCVATPRPASVSIHT
jgi:hypothetical protein